MAILDEGEKTSSFKKVRVGFADSRSLVRISTVMILEGSETTLRTAFNIAAQNGPYLERRGLQLRFVSETFARNLY